MLKKGDRVEFKGVNGSKTIYGTVTKGGKKKITVVEDGGEFQHTGPPSVFKISDKPLPTDDPSPMDKYEIRKWKSAGGEETERFEADVYRDGEYIGKVFNGGTGGPDTFHLKGDDFTQFQKDVKAWAKQMGGEDMYEPDSFWAHWWWKDRKFGITAKEAISNHEKAMEELYAKYPRS